MIYARKLFYDAKEYDDFKAKARTLKMAYNAAVGISDYVLVEEIEKYAYDCGIDLDKVSGYDF